MVSANDRAADNVREALEVREYSRAPYAAMAYADTVNQAFDAAKPWVMAKVSARPTTPPANSCKTSARVHLVQTLTVVWPPSCPN